MDQQPEILVDQMTGRSEIDALEGDLSLEERLSRYEQAELGLLMTQAAQERGIANTDITGSTQDIEEAIKILEASADFRASQITESELKTALQEGLMRGDIGHSLRERRSVAQKSSSSDYADLYDQQLSIEKSENDLSSDKDIDIADDI